MKPERISIICKDHTYTVIADGRIVDELFWEEMLGHIARITLGQPSFHDHVLGEKYRWPIIAGLLAGKH